MSPVLYLAAMGVGLGSLVHRSAAIGGVTYLQFIGPGLLAATAMQVGAAESTYAVLGSFKWMRVYHAMAATPLHAARHPDRPPLWIATRIAMASGVYLAVVAAFGGIKSPLALVAWPACLLIGMAFAGPIVAFSSTRETDNGFAALNRFGIVPMFLFSGTFFPISQLPEVLRWIAYATPLWHGVELVRSLCLGHRRRRRSRACRLSRWRGPRSASRSAVRQYPTQARGLRWRRLSPGSCRSVRCRDWADGRGRVLVERSLMVYRHSWIIIVSGFFEPVFYLFSIGVGLGHLVPDLNVNGQHVSYTVVRRAGAARVVRHEWRYL